MMTIYYFIFAIIWLLWRSNPLAHRTGLIATGILGLRSAGFIPGLLVLIAGIIAPKKETGPTNVTLHIETRSAMYTSRF
ncbi:MAG: hypothetical protein ACFFCH_07125 [Promethearchaeota archaeon]